MKTFIPTLRFAWLLFAVAACAPVEEAPQGSWVLEEEEPSTREHAEDVDQRHPSERGPQLPVADPSRDCPGFDGDDPDEFFFDLYRFLACRRAPDESLLFSPALVQIALAEAAEHAPEDQASHIAGLLGDERLQDLLTRTDHLRESLLSRRPMAASTTMDRGGADYEIEETNLDTLQRSLGIEFYASSCEADECTWIPQNQRWHDKSLHSFPPSPAFASNETLSMIVRAQSEAESETYFRATSFPTATGETLWFLPLHTYTTFWRRTEMGHVFDWRLVGSKLSIMFFRPLNDVSLDVVEEALSSELVEAWIHATQESNFPMGLGMPPLHIEERIDVGEVVGLDQIRTTTRLSVGNHGLNEPEPVDLEITWTTEPNPNAWGTPSYFLGLYSPFLFMLYDRELEVILLLGRVARPY